MKDRKGKRRQPAETAKVPGKAAPARQPAAQRRPVIFCILLFCVTLAAFIQVADYGFIILDDADYVVNNPMIRKGLSVEGIRWAFSNFDAGLWKPVTWLSYLFDWQIYGLKAGGFHITNVLIHAAGAVSLFLALQLMTGAFWPSAAVATLFAIHPLRVESVAWVAERKDVLSALFWFLTMGAYARYVRQPGWGRYALMILFFVLGLMSKPMLVTLPVVLLLLDWWPLRRTAAPMTIVDRWMGNPPAGRAALRLVAEKLPMIALSIVFSWVAFLAEKSIGAVAHHVPLSVRLANAAVSGAEYLRMLVWPVNLAVFYPLRGMPEMWIFLGAAALLTLVTAGALYGARRAPYLFTGWLWYLATLAPVIGIVQLGAHAMADRFTYIPHVGLLMALVWGVAELSRTWPRRGEILSGAGALIVIALVSLTWMQVRHWQSDYTLFSHAIRVVPQNHRAHLFIGMAFLKEGRIDQGTSHLREFVRLRPELPDNYYIAGNLLLRHGRTQEAMEVYEAGLKVDPGMWYAHLSLGNALLSRGEAPKALFHLQEAVRLKPDDSNVWSSLGDALALAGRAKEAAEAYAKALRINPLMPEVHYNLGLLLASQGRLDDSIGHFRDALRIKPGYARAHNNLGTVFLMQKRYDEAIENFQDALRLQPDYQKARDNLREAEARKKAGR